MVVIAPKSRRLQCPAAGRAVKLHSFMFPKLHTCTDYRGRPRDQAPGPSRSPTAFKIHLINLLLPNLFMIITCAMDKSVERLFELLNLFDLGCGGMAQSQCALTVEEHRGRGWLACSCLRVLLGPAPQTKRKADLPAALRVLPMQVCCLQQSYVGRKKRNATQKAHARTHLQNLHTHTK